MIVVHVVWGDTVAERQAEVMELAQVYQFVQEANGDEEDVLLVGDFNREPNDTMAYGNLMALPSMTYLFRLPEKSHIRDTSLYDNIFFQTDHVTEYLGRSGIDKFDETDFGNDDTAANLAVSDHRPVWAVFSIDGSDAPSIVQELPTADATPQIATVYVTKTGKKYHRETCRWGKIPIALAEAKQEYEPCSRCNPPR